MTTNTLDLSSFEEITVDFSYYAVSMDNSNEDFWLQISYDGGSTFTTIEDWARNVDFQNNSREYATVDVSGPFTSTVRLRFRCDASANNDKVYIDDVVISGCGSPANKTSNETSLNSTWYEIIEGTNEDNAPKIKLYPTLTNANVFLEVEAAKGERASIMILDIAGRVHLQENVAITGSVLQLNYDVSKLIPGVYFVSVKTPYGISAQKFIKK